MLEQAVPDGQRLRYSGAYQGRSVKALAIVEHCRVEESVRLVVGLAAGLVAAAFVAVVAVEVVVWPGSGDGVVVVVAPVVVVVVVVVAVFGRAVVAVAVVVVAVASVLEVVLEEVVVLGVVVDPEVVLEAVPADSGLAAVAASGAAATLVVSVAA